MIVESRMIDIAIPVAFADEFEILNLAAVNLPQDCIQIRIGWINSKLVPEIYARTKRL